MSGALGYLPIEEGVRTTLENLETWLSDCFELESPDWKVAFGQSGMVAVDGPSSELIEIPVLGRISEQIPEEYADDSGNIKTDIFPVGPGHQPGNITPEESEGHEEVLARTVVELHELGDTSASPPSTLREIIARHEDQGIVDAFGNAWSERDSLLASKAAEQSLSLDDPDVIVSFDVLRTLVLAFQYECSLTYRNFQEGKQEKEDEVEFDKVIRAKPLSNDDLPEVKKVYVHQNKRVVASEYQISSNEIASSLRGRVLGWAESCTIRDPSGRGLLAQVGSVTKIVLNEDQDDYHGFVRVSTEADISLVYDFYTALRVPEAPFLTNKVAQETADWDRDHEQFSGWSAANDGFAFHSLDGRREIRRRLFAHKYWVIHGEKYRKKREFEEDVEALVDIIESEMGCDVSWREFGGERVQKTPIQQSTVIDQMREEARAPPDQDAIIEAVGGFASNSEEVEGIDAPLFPSDLSEFVADTSIIDAQIITRLVSEGDLYDTTIVVPEVVLEEVHRQVDQDTSRGKLGLEELTALRELSEKGILDFEVVPVEDSVDTEDNISVDQALMRIAKKREVPLCSADETLLQLAEAAGVTAYPLKQELSQWNQLIKNSLKQRGELPRTELIRMVYQQMQERRVSEDSVQRNMFWNPGRVPQEDLATEMAINEEIDRLERRGEIYSRGEQVGLKKEVAIVPSLNAIENGVTPEKIQEGDLADRIDLSRYESRFKVVLPASFEYWASLQASQKYLTGLHELENLEKKNQIDIEWRDVLPSETGLVLADEEQFSNLMQGLQRKAAVDFDHSAVVDTGSGSITVNY
ncbi:PIN domain-containing protein [Halorussus halophilus]|uniref:hypothetical protein n=1 Tax=Halorussus halophilus TaxID=2650975 RepID=UPI00130168F5|nr:hypothetical protein [Halorussus halophilus]